MVPTIVEIDGRRYVPRPVDIPVEFTVTTALALYQNQRVILPGIAKFMLLALSRDTIVAGASVARRFKFRYGLSDGGVQFTQAGVGATNDRVIDSNLFGTGAFPRPIIPGIIFDASSTIMFEIEDVSNNVPYTIHIDFIGQWLIPTS